MAHSNSRTLTNLADLPHKHELIQNTLATPSIGYNTDRIVSNEAFCAYRTEVHCTLVHVRIIVPPGAMHLLK
ncbi:hypothetical protein NMYAN_150024 [Nitrosomonas nitrosa]|uniref:Uncharacterized protein n=1 Tax=Nitrosomonas nitrosa TaxID=52442 RepID=A0A8H8Z0M6_9PROT|nr:hypothetical protein NMYAN_150024 [Nitrosomonas nitrosa]